MCILLIIDYIIILLYFWVIWNRCLLVRFSVEKAAYQNWETDSINNFSFNNLTIFAEKLHNSSLKILVYLFLKIHSLTMTDIKLQ